MTTTKLESVTIKSSDSKGSGAVSYDKTTLIQSGNLKITFGAGVLNFATMAEYRIFVDEVVIPMTNTINSASGSGVGYAAVTPGTPGADKIIN